MEQKFIEIAKTIIQSLDYYRDAGRDDNFNEVSIAEYLQRQQNFCKPDVVRCKELLIPMQHKEYNAIGVPKVTATLQTRKRITGLSLLLMFFRCSMNFQSYSAQRLGIYAGVDIEKYLLKLLKN